jgi:hypothetical protein
MAEAAERRQYPIWRRLPPGCAQTSPPVSYTDTAERNRAASGFSAADANALLQRDIHPRGEFAPARPQIARTHTEQQCKMTPRALQVEKLRAEYGPNVLPTKPK